MNDQELLRYSRHLLLPQVDVEGQERILKSRVLLVGAGGLGCPAAAYLASSGVGTLVVADDDRVEISNLQRQILHTESRLGQLKVDSLKAGVSDINSSTKVETFPFKLTRERLDEQVAQADVVLDCSDNLQTRHQVNESCYSHKTPLISGAAIRFEAQVSVYDARHPNSPCYRCLYSTDEDSQLSCSEAGVLSPLVGMVGSMQAIEALKIIGGFGESMTGKLLVLDSLTMQWQTLTLNKRKGCAVCG